MGGSCHYDTYATTTHRPRAGRATRALPRGLSESHEGSGTREIHDTKSTFEAGRQEDIIIFLPFYESANDGNAFCDRVRQYPHGHDQGNGHNHQDYEGIELIIARHHHTEPTL